MNQRKKVRQDSETEKIERYVAEIVEAAPPLSEEQAAKIAALLRPARGGVGLY